MVLPFSAEASKPLCIRNRTTQRSRNQIRSTKSETNSNNQNSNDQNRLEKDLHENLNKIVVFQIPHTLEGRIGKA